MRELRDLARKLLTDGEVALVIGWERGPLGLRPSFVTSPGETERLDFGPGAVHNLATYLSPRRNHLRVEGRVAVVLKACDARAVAGLIREGQVEREDLVLIGVRCEGVYEDPKLSGPLTEANMADRCATCVTREPTLADHVVGELPPRHQPSGSRPPKRESRRGELIRRIEAMSPAERMEFWRGELGRCVRCHACREVCPLCACTRCVASKTEPVWIESSSHPRACFAWHMTRAMHLAGRCADCGECERACPVGVPLSVINTKVATAAKEMFGYTVGEDPLAEPLIGSFRLDDPQEFIK